MKHGWIMILTVTLIFVQLSESTAEQFHLSDRVSCVHVVQTIQQHENCCQNNMF